MDINGCFPSNYLKASDLQGSTVSVTIRTVSMEQLDNEEKPVVHFQGKKKGLVLNRVNGFTIAGMYGPETDAWLGKVIKLRPEKTAYQGRPIDCIRVHVDSPEAPEGTTHF